jgi:hypothetical protein
MGGRVDPRDLRVNVLDIFAVAWIIAVAGPT